jgi:hypothetical protein
MSPAGNPVCTRLSTVSSVSLPCAEHPSANALHCTLQVWFVLQARISFFGRAQACSPFSTAGLIGSQGPNVGHRRWEYALAAVVQHDVGAMQRQGTHDQSTFTYNTRTAYRTGKRDVKNGLHGERRTIDDVRESHPELDRSSVEPVLIGCDATSTLDASTQPLLCPHGRNEQRHSTHRFLIDTHPSCPMTRPPSA